MSQQEKKGSAGVAAVPLRLAADKDAEHSVQGDLAGMTHLMEQAYSTSGVACEIARRCRRRHPVLGDQINSLQVEALDQIVERMDKAEAATKRALQDAIGASSLLAHCYRPRLEERRR